MKFRLSVKLRDNAYSWNMIRAKESRQRETNYRRRMTKAV